MRLGSDLVLVTHDLTASVYDPTDPGSAPCIETSIIDIIRRRYQGQRFLPFKIIGDAMASTCLPGDTVLVDLIDISPTPPGIFIICDGMSLLPQRVEHLANSQPAKVRLSSDNPRYAAFERPLAELHVLGRVVGKWAAT